MPDITVKIRAKGCDATGITEEHARQLFNRKGSHGMGIVEWKVEEVHEKSDGTRRVDLVLTQVEPSTDDRLEEHLRELTRTLYYNRGVTDGQPTLPDDDGPNPKISDMIDAGSALIERDENGDPVGLWDGDPDNLPDDEQPEDGFEDEDPTDTTDTADTAEEPAYDADNPELDEAIDNADTVELPTDDQADDDSTDDEDAVAPVVFLGADR